MANKQELLEEAKELGLDVKEDINYNELSSLVASKKKENEEPKAVEEEADFLLMVSDLDHNVAKVLNEKKGVSLFKFGRKDKNGGVVPTRVPKKFAEALMDSYPGKYKTVDVPKEHKKDLTGYFAKLIEAQDDIDDFNEQERLRQEIKEKEALLKEMQKAEKNKKIIRE